MSEAQAFFTIEAVRSFRFDHLPEVSFSRAGSWVPLLAGKGVQALEIRSREMSFQLNPLFDIQNTLTFLDS
jgi:hypothetical protein